MKMNEYLVQAKDFEQSKAAFQESRVKTYKFIAFLGAFFGVASLVALMIALPLKEKELAVIRVNEITGDTDIITKLSDGYEMTKDEALDKFNVSRYIKAREGYWFDLVRKDYDFVLSQTAADIAGDYTKIYSGSNGRAENLKDQVIIEPLIRSITLGTSNGAPTATIRILLKRKEIQSGEVKHRSLIVTLGYTYNVADKMSEVERWENPFGFVVNAYRVDFDNE